jgi:hypothetical protein
VHKVRNASATEGAVSLHIYAPGWATVHTYDEEAGATANPTDAGGAELSLDAWGDF